MKKNVIAYFGGGLGIFTLTLMFAVYAANDGEKKAQPIQKTEVAKSSKASLPKLTEYQSSRQFDRVLNKYGENISLAAEHFSADRIKTSGFPYKGWGVSKGDFYKRFPTHMYRYSILIKRYNGGTNVKFSNFKHGISLTLKDGKYFSYGLHDAGLLNGNMPDTKPVGVIGSMYVAVLTDEVLDLNGAVLSLPDYIDSETGDETESTSMVLNYDK